MGFRVIRRSLTLILVLTSCCLIAQSDLEVELLDSETLEAVSFATIKFQGTSQGLIADYNGQFRLPKRLTDTISTLEITSIGFQPLEVIVDSLSFTALNVLKMKPQVVQLEAVVLNVSKKNKARGNRINQSYRNAKAMSAYAIVRKAINFIDYNLSQKPHSHIGYYRDYQMLNNGIYYNLNEAIIEQFDGGILTNKINSSSNQTAIYSYRRNENFRSNNLMSSTYDNQNKYLLNANVINYGGNELTLLNVHDPIRIHAIRSFSFVYDIETDFFKNHQFLKGDIEFLNDDPVITINLVNDLESVNAPYRVEGQLKISLLDFSIYGFDYSVFINNLVNPIFKTKVEYQRINDKMYLNYATFNNQFFVKDDDEFKEKSVSFDKDENSFIIEFNRAMNPKTAKKRNFKLSFKEDRVSISKIQILDEKSVKLYISDNGRADISQISPDNSNMLKIQIKRVTDKNGREVYERVNVKVYQFREYFVQEVFENKSPPDDMIFVNKLRPISESKIIDFDKLNKYIVNSPLMKRKL